MVNKYRNTKVNYPIVYPVRLGVKQAEAFKSKAKKNGHRRSALIRSWIDNYIQS